MGRIWKIRKRIIGGEKATLEATTVVDPKNGKLAVSKHQIRTVTLQYCKETLDNNKPSKGYEGVMQDKKDNLTMKLLECNWSFSPTFEGFQALVRKFKVSRKQNYNFLVKASEYFQNTVFKFSRIVI